MNNNEVSYKPIVIPDSKSEFYRQNIYAQNILLKALASGITDPKELKNIMGVKTVADVYRTLDKIAIRKDFHRALYDNGISLDYIVQGLRSICDDSQSDSVRLKGFQTLLRSIGLDRYELEDAGGGKTWEQLIKESAEGESKQLSKSKKTNNDDNIIEGEIEEYEVKIPILPEEEKEAREREKKFSDELYKLPEEN